MKIKRHSIIIVFGALAAIIAPCLAGGLISKNDMEKSREIVTIAGGDNSAAPSSSSGQAGLGIRLDPNPLPELLHKHLQLAADEGLLIANVLTDGPADKAGLEQDDIIVKFQNKPVKDFNGFVEAVRAAGVGASVNLEVVHLGQRKTVTAALAAWPDKQTWKYADRPATVERHQPGRVFRMQPGQRHWQQIPGQSPDMKDFLQRFYRNQYSYRSSDGRLDIDVIIEGNPRDKNANITVHDKKTNTDYHITADKIDQLPEQFRQIVQDTVKSAKRSSVQTPGNDFKFGIPFDVPDEGGAAPSPFEEQRFQEQLRDMRQRLEQMERQYQDMQEHTPQQAPPAEPQAPDDQDSQSGDGTEYL
jgi:hypothetical protein